MGVFRNTSSFCVESSQWVSWIIHHLWNKIFDWTVFSIWNYHYKMYLKFSIFIIESIPPNHVALAVPLFIPELTVQPVSCWNLNINLWVWKSHLITHFQCHSHICKNGGLVDHEFEMKGGPLFDKPQSVVIKK